MHPNNGNDNTTITTKKKRRRAPRPLRASHSSPASARLRPRKKRKRYDDDGQQPLRFPPSLQSLKEQKQRRDLSCDYSTAVKTRGLSVRVLFRNQKQALIGALQSRDVLVYGCVAWLTDFDILNALAGKSLGIVVQKEEFLRPDKVLKSRRLWTETLRRKYDATVFGGGYYPCQFPVFPFESRLTDITRVGQYQQDTMGAVRCIGYHRRTGDLGVPLMHHKFLVFARLHTVVADKHDRLEPFGVWTGSFNMSTNASNSLENVVVIDDPAIAAAYSKEWANLYLNSEPLDWTHEYAVLDPTDDFRVET